MRQCMLLLALDLPACAAATYGPVGPGGQEGEAWGPNGGGDPDADFWSIDLDTSATDPFLVDFPATATVRGTVSASEGLARVEVAGQVVQTDRSGAFAVEVPVTPGLQVVPVQAFDTAGHSRNGHRGLIAARYLPEGDINAGAAGITVTNDLLAALAGDQLDQVGDLDLSDEIMSQGNMSQQGCDITVRSARHGRPSLALAVDGGALTVTFTIPDLVVTFSGECDMFISSTSFTGDLTTDVVVHTALTAPPSTACLETFAHTYPTVDLPGFDLSIQSNDGGLIGMLVPLVGEMMQDQFATQMSDQIATQADGLINEQVAQFGQMGLGEDAVMQFNGVDLSVGFCMTGLESVDGVLRARLGLSVTGPGGTRAPGAPMVDGEMGPTSPSTLWLDANLISQMMFSLWSAGGLSGESTGDVTTGLLGLLVPEIADMFPGDTPVTVGIEGLLPPVVRAAGPASDGDLLVDIAGLVIDLSVDGELLFRMSAFVHLTLDLQNQDGSIKPAIVDSSAEVVVLDEPIADVDDAVLQSAVEMQIGGQAESLLGDTGFGLPAFGGISLVPQDAVPEPGGRYVRVTLAP